MFLLAQNHTTAFHLTHIGSLDQDYPTLHHLTDFTSSTLVILIALPVFKHIKHAATSKPLPLLFPLSGMLFCPGIYMAHSLISLRVVIKHKILNEDFQGHLTKNYNCLVPSLKTSTSLLLFSCTLTFI